MRTDNTRESVSTPSISSMGEKALEGARSRMSEHSNNPLDVRCSSPTADFGNWDDWDNGHSDS